MVDGVLGFRSDYRMRQEIKDEIEDSLRKIMLKYNYVLEDNNMKTHDISELQLIQSEMNEAYTGNAGDILTHKHYKDIEIELIESTNKGWKVYQTTGGKKKKIAYFTKQDITGPKSLFERVDDEQLDEKLITFSNRAPYGQIVFMAGGAGSGKGYAIDNFLDSASFKVRDVDEMKKAVGNLDKLGKFSIDEWFKKYSGNLPEDQRKHIEDNVLGKGLTISQIAGDLKNPNNVMSLHFIVDAMGLKDQWLINMLKGKGNKETLPNLLFDITAKKVSSITNVIRPLLSVGYEPKNIHLVWVLTNYHIAVSQNKSRDRVVADDILLNTHEGAAKTIWGLITQGLPNGLDGRIDVILGGGDNTIYHTDSKGNKITSTQDKVKVNLVKGDDNKMHYKRVSKKDAVNHVKGFVSLPVKKQGGGILPEKLWKEILYKWIIDNAPKTISLRNTADR
jgi:hypothetical protein